MANPQHVEIVKKGAAAVIAWREENPRGKLDLSRADFSDYDLTGVNLTSSDLAEANLRRANLQSTKLDHARLTSAHLNGANLTDATLSSAKLDGASLRNADLSGAGLAGARLIGADLNGTDLRDAELANTNLQLADLRNARIDSTTRFSLSMNVLQCRVDRYTMEYMWEHLTQGKRMDLVVSDDIAELRLTYSGIWMWSHVVSLIVFCVPYVWFIAQQWSVAKFRQLAQIDADSITLWEAVGRFIWNGGVGWRDGWDLNGWSFGCFCAVLAYNIVRVALLWKTKKLEAQQEVNGLPVQFSLRSIADVEDGVNYEGNWFANSRDRLLAFIFSWERYFGISRWLVLYNITYYGYWVMLALVLKNTMHFLSMKVPVAMP